MSILDLTQKRLSTTIWRETFEGENFREFHGFAAVRESFLYEIWGVVSLVRQKRAVRKSCNYSRKYESLLRLIPILLMLIFFNVFPHTGQDVDEDHTKGNDALCYTFHFVCKKCGMNQFVIGIIFQAGIYFLGILLTSMYNMNNPGGHR